VGMYPMYVFASAAIPHANDTDELIKRNNPSWLTETIEPMSVRDQLASINKFKAAIDTYREQTGYILPLGKNSKAKLRKISSWMYSNLVAESFNQSDLPLIIECTISLSECLFSNHYLFYALEYQLWTYNHEPPGLGDLGYTRLFYAMAQSQYFPKQQTFGACTFHPTCPEQENLEETSTSSFSSLDASLGFEFHEHLGRIVEYKGKKIQKSLGFYKKKEIAKILTNIIIGYNMMSSKAFSNIKSQFDSRTLVFPLDTATTTLADLLATYADHEQRKRFIKDAIPNKKNLYRSLLLDFICKPETGSSANSCFDLTQEMPTDELRKHRKVILDLREVINSEPVKKTKPSGFEIRVKRELSSAHYKVEDNVYDPNLCSELDLVVTNTQTGEVTRIEPDGYFHFNQNFHGADITSDLNGETRLKSSLLQHFGKVLRISGACDDAEYENRIRIVSSVMRGKDFKNNRVWFIPSPRIGASEYASCNG
jgi:hypothetical protein